MYCTLFKIASIMPLGHMERFLKKVLMLCFIILALQISYQDQQDVNGLKCNVKLKLKLEYGGYRLLEKVRQDFGFRYYK